jgi:hypothetical protein
VGIRIVLAILIALGVITAWSAQLGDTTQRMAMHRVTQFLKDHDAEQRPENAPVRDAAAALDGSVRMWNVSLYAGLGIVVVAGAGWSLAKKR